ncbi:hypothetical protein ACJX0J_022917, partial [Zea mays]
MEDRCAIINETGYSLDTDRYAKNKMDSSSLQHEKKTDTAILQVHVDKDLSVEGITVVFSCLLLLYNAHTFTFPIAEESATINILIGFEPVCIASVEIYCDILGIYAQYML